MATAPYVINPDDPTNPTENLTMGAAAAELRALKQRVLLARQETADLETRALTHEGANPYELDAKLNANGNKITELPTATEASDATPLSQVLAIVGAAGSGIVSSVRQEWTATEGQTAFVLTLFTYVPTANNLAVYVNGLRQDTGSAYIETSSTAFTFTEGLKAGDVVHAFSNESVDADAVALLREDLASPASGKGAGMVRWIRNAFGAVSRWVSDKLSETVGIKDFGAVVDGVADDTGPIQKARAAASGKFPLVFGGKTYASGYWENLSPLIQEWVLGSDSEYKTDVISTKPLTSTKLFTGTPQTGSGFAAYGHRTDIYTQSGVDVASTVGFASVVNALSTNTGGSSTNNNTNQVAILANSSAQSATASAPVTAINAIAASAYTGATWQQVVGVEVDVSAANPPGYFGDASKATSFGVSCILVDSSAYSATAAYGADTSKSGAGWLHGALLAGCVNTGVTIARNTVTPHTGLWVSAAGTYGVYVGAKPLHYLQPGQVPTYSAQHNPAIGIALGQTNATNGRSNYLRFTATDGSSLEQHFDLYSTATALILRFAGSDKFSVSSTGAISINGTQVLSNRDTGFSPMTGTQNKGTVYDTSSVTLQQLAQRVAALQQALAAHGIIGA